MAASSSQTSKRRIKEVLRALNARYKLGLITNGRSRSQNAKIDYAGIREFFGAIKISEEGVKKPNPVIFGRCLSQLGVTPKRAVYVGDHPEKDIVAAQRAGLSAIWMRNAHYRSAEGVVDNLSELPKMLTFLPFVSS